MTPRTPWSFGFISAYSGAVDYRATRRGEESFRLRVHNHTGAARRCDGRPLTPDALADFNTWRDAACAADAARFRARHGDELADKLDLENATTPRAFIPDTEEAAA